MGGHQGEAAVPTARAAGRGRRDAPAMWAVFAPIVLLLAAGVIFAVLGIYNVPPLRARFLGGAYGCAALAGIIGMVLLYRQSRGRQVASRDLHSAELRVSEILESAMDSIITVDGEQRIVGFNHAAEDTFGHRRGEVIGRPLDILIPARYRRAHHEHVEAFGSAGTTARRMGVQTVLTGLRADGGEFPIEASISQHLERGDRYFTVILRDVTERVAADAELRASRDELRELGAAAHMAREQETSRIARELHDELGQALTALKIDTTWLREHMGGAPADVQEKLRSMQSMLDGTVASARRISSELRPLMLDDLGLTAAAEWLAQNFTNRTGIPCELVIGTGDLDLPDPYATAVFRVLQESLTNVTKHAEATQVEATLERDGDGVVLTVQDNGRGFATGDPRNPGSFGLVGLRERALLVGGEVRVDSAPGQGTRVELRVPLATEGAPA